MIQLNSTPNFVDFVYPPLTNYVLSSVASQTQQTKISPEDIVDVEFLKSNVLIRYVDWEGDLNSCLLSIAVFKNRAWNAHHGEGIIEAAKSLIKGSTHQKLEIVDNSSQIEFGIAELDVSYDNLSGKPEPTSLIPLIIFTAHKNIDFWQVESAEGEWIFTDKQQAIAYFKSLYYSFATNFSIGQFVNYRGSEWQIDRFTKNKAVLIREENGGTIYTSVSIVEGELIGAEKEKVNLRMLKK
ncbi:MAG: hypothetical protein ACRDBG_04550 [Waterburya sp.]